MIGLGAKIFPDRPNLPRISPRISPRSPQLGRSQEVSQARRALRPSPPLGPAGQGPGRAPAQESERPGGKAPRAGILEPGSADHLPNGDAGPLLVVANGQGTAEKIAAALSERLADQGMPPLTNDQLESATTRNWRSDTSSAAGSTNTARPNAALLENHERSVRSPPNRWCTHRTSLSPSHRRHTNLGAQATRASASNLLAAPASR